MLLLFLPQAESYKKKVNTKEYLSINILELSGTILKQGFLIKQVTMTSYFQTNHRVGMKQFLLLSSKALFEMAF